MHHKRQQPRTGGVAGSRVGVLGAAALVVGLGVVLGAAGCGVGTVNWGWTEPLVARNDLRVGYNAFAPESVRVFPLTHLGYDDAGQPAIVCHIELRDRWGDSVKALGPLQVQLYRPMGGLEATSATQILKWDVPLQDERENAAAYDPATQTYRVVLVQLPGWIAERAEPDPDRARIRLEIRAVFQTLGPNGEEKVLRDGMVLEI